ncbi:MAG: hypothetical protein OXN44_01355 [Acidimicrobiaceae bacterium]|nr:hypothetical protein [Acidimicrobiaceae bacterium]MDE0608050.1 hypothetical protein [Acidimicrobiaceae bacterium]
MTVVLVLALGPAVSAEGIEGTGIVLTPGGLVVTAGSPGSLALSSEPGQPGRGTTIYCSWYNFSVEFGEYLFDPIGDSVWPSVNSTYLLNCWTRDPAQSYPGYPTITKYRGPGDIAGSAVSSEDAARFARAHINFELPRIQLSPPSRQIVGVPTWLAVVSRLRYDQVSANAGPVWASARASLRDVTWNLGNGASRVCTRDVSKVWDSTSSHPQASRCTYTYVNSAGSPFNLTATVRWNIWQRTNSNPSWHQWGTISRTTTIPINVTQLQSAIR